MRCGNVSHLKMIFTGRGLPGGIEFEAKVAKIDKTVENGKLGLWLIVMGSKIMAGR